MKTNRKLILLGVSFIILILYLFSSNTLIMNFIVNPDLRPVKTLFSQFDSSQNTVFTFEHYEYLGGIYEIFSIDGWAFSETSHPSSDKTISVLLKCEENDNVYEISNDAIFRPDVYGAFYETHKINGFMHGFATQFASFNIPLGRYNVYLFVHENDTDYGLIDTNYIFIKEKDAVKMDLNSLNSN